MATFGELIRALEDSTLREDVKTFAINALIDAALAESGKKVPVVSEEGRAKFYARFRAIAARLEP